MITVNLLIALRTINQRLNIFIPTLYILQRYNEEHRFFHTIKHVNDIIRQIFLVEDLTQDEEAILLLAAIFHDIIYYPDKNDNEEKSVEYLNTYVVETNSSIEKAKEIILSTKNHNSEDKLCKIFNTLDCSIMSKNYDDLLIWEKEIKAEYSFVDLKTYKEKRIEFLNNNISKYPDNENNLKKLIRLIREYKNSVEIRCYRIKCKYNEFSKVNCGYCLKSEIQLTKDGCMDYIKI